jgi:hypothetical protein
MLFSKNNLNKKENNPQKYKIRPIRFWVTIHGIVGGYYSKEL